MDTSEIAATGADSPSDAGGASASRNDRQAESGGAEAAEGSVQSNADRTGGEAPAASYPGEASRAAEEPGADPSGPGTGSARGGGDGAAKPAGPRAPSAEFASTLSDRAIQRITGGNAFLRGRIYARKNAVEGLFATGEEAGAEIHVRNADEPYKPRFRLDEEHKITSSCTCPGWRGPTGHCKHVAALLVALRDRERPPKPKGNAPKKEKNAASPPVHVPQTVSVGGKRRRSRRRRRGATGDGEKISVLSTRDLSGAAGADRGGLDAWLPQDHLPKSLDFEYRMAVRAASIAVTPVLAGSRSAVPIGEALGSSNMVSTSDRALFRALGRHTSRGQPATAELRGEDAAEILAMLQGRRVLLEPASMELRFSEEPLRAAIELDSVPPDSVRVRVVFEAGSGGRRFALSSGAWFEGTPGYHIDTTDGVARPLADAVTPAWLQRLYRSPALVHRTEQLPMLLTEFLPAVAASLAATLPDLSSVADVVDAHPRIGLKANGDIVTAEVRLLVGYADQEYDIPASGFPSPLAVLPGEGHGDRPRVVRRDVGAEMSAVQELLNLGFEPDEATGLFLAEGDTAVSFWSEGIGTLPESWDRFVPDDLVDVTIRNSSVTPQMRISSGVDWLSLDMSFDSGGIAVNEAELRIALEKNRRLVKLEDGSYAPIEQNQVAEVMGRMAEILATSGDQKRLPLSQAGRIQDLIGVVGGANVSSKARSLFDKLEHVDGIEMVSKPRNLKAKLRDYQKLGFSWLVFIHNLGSGGILADDMGLGKTLQAIALLLWNKANSKKSLPSLVVAPTSVVPNWQREIKKFAPSLETIVWQGPNRHDQKKALKNSDVIITSYALIRRDEELFEKLKLGYAILDEAQHIKNPLSATARAAKRLGAERRLALTGTPIENRLSEFWSIVDFVSPGLLGSLKNFEEKVARPIDRGDEATAERLRKTIQPFVLRRTKQQVAPELPEKIEQEMIVPLGEGQAKLYQQILREVRKSVLSEVEKQGVSKAQIQILAALTRLRQVACDPRLMKLPDSEEWSDESSGKLQALRELVQEAVSGGHRVLVFSQFVQMLQLIRAALDEDDIKYEYLDGSTKDRIEKVDRFNEDASIGVFLISLKAGGTGLNLVGADTVIHFDPWWNPAVEDQATDRAHRIGQTRNVSVYRLIARGTVEEKILELSDKKRALVANVLSSEGSPLKGLTKSDVDELFSDLG